MMFKRRDPQSTLERLRQFFWPRAGWARAVQYLWQRTVRIKGAPHDIALGLAIGAFISATPLLGTHFILAGLLAYFLGGNLLASMAGTWVGNPLTFPFIWIGTYTLGTMFLGRGADVSDVPQLSFAVFLEAPLSTLGPAILPMLLGAIPIGLVLGVATYYPSLWAIEIYQKRREAMMAKKAKARQDALDRQEKEGE
jgi:uncharacterized protein (DUF2062 family)